MDLILASTSPYRKALLARLQRPFRCLPPETDETPLAGESGEQLALRLAVDKARSVARAHPRSLVIGSDQVALLGDTLVGKPGNLDNARKQLSASSGRRVLFLTGLALCMPRAGSSSPMSNSSACIFASCPPRQLRITSHASSPWTAPGASSVRGLASRCSSAWKVQTRPALKACH